MWKWNEDDNSKASSAPTQRPPNQSEPISAPAASMKESRSMEGSNPVSSQRAEVAHIGKSVLVRGELSGSEDLYVDGKVEGSIELREHNLTVGPNGRVDANVN